MVVRLVTTLVASEVERVRAPERASREAIGAFLHDLLSRGFGDRGELLARAAELGVELEAGASVVVARAHAHVATEDGWRARVLMIAERGARAAVPAAVAALRERAEAVGAEIVVLVPTGDEQQAERAAEAIVRELTAALPGHTFAVGRSRVAGDPLLLDRAGNEALLAANVAEGDADAAVLAFEETGAYRLLLPAMSEDPAELQRFYAETVEPLVVYDEQYATDLVQTVEAFLDADGNVAGTARQALHPPPHDPVPPRARARAVGPRRRLDRRPGEAEPRPEGDARARHRRARRPLHRGGMALARSAEVGAS